MSIRELVFHYYLAEAACIYRLLVRQLYGTAITKEIGPEIGPVIGPGNKPVLGDRLILPNPVIGSRLHN